jgi:O-antigen ligase
MALAGGGVAFGVMCVALLSILAFQDALVSVAVDPESFTGRGAIWSAMWSMFLDKPIIGYGYSSIFGVGDSSPWQQYASGWVSQVAHGHNGYLELATSVGVVGFALFLMAFVVAPLRDFLRMSLNDNAFVAVLTSIFAFVLFHNMMESTLMDRAQPQWVTWLLVCAIARTVPQERSHAAGDLTIAAKSLNKQEAASGARQSGSQGTFQ